MLDVSTQAALLEAIAAIQQERDLAVLLTHDRVLADAWCEDVADIRELEAHHEDAPRRRPAVSPI